MSGNNRAAGIVFTDGFHILLMKRSECENEHTWDLPGGHSKANETPIETAERETKEETGIKKIPGEFFNHFKNDGYTTFFCNVKKTFKIKVNKEHSEYNWVKFKDIKNKNLHPKLKLSMKKILKIIKKNIKKFNEWVVLKNEENFFN